MVWLLDGEKIVKICLLVSTEYTKVTDGRTNRRTPCDDIGAYNKNLAIADRSRVSCAHNTSRAFMGLFKL